MRMVIARIFDYSLDGIIAGEGTSFFDFCRDLPDDLAQEDRTRAFYGGAGGVGFWRSLIRLDLIDEYRVSLPDHDRSRENTLTRFPAGSLNTIDRLPQGWVVGGITHSTPRAAIRGYSASTSSTRKSRMISSRP
jgi:hypothetical protein